MKIQPDHRPAGIRGSRAFTLVEVCVSMVIVGIIVLAVYGALSSGVGTVRMARENLRATQILLEKVEGIRLYTWDQLNSPGFVPTTFIAPYDALTTNTNSGVLYFGRITIANSTNATSYADTMRVVTVTIDWKTGSLSRSRSVQTYVAQAGIQNYIY